MQGVDTGQEDGQHQPGAYLSFLAKAGFSPGSGGSAEQQELQDAREQYHSAEAVHELQQQQQQQPPEDDPAAAEELRKAVSRAVSAARKAWAQQHRQAMQVEIAANAAQLRDALQQQQEEAAASWPRWTTPLPRTAQPGSTWPSQAQQAGLAASLAAAADPAPSKAGKNAAGGGGPSATKQQQQQQQAEPRPAPPQPLTQARPASNIVGGRPQQLQAFIVPSHPPLPEYKAWSHVRGNVLSLEVGQRMFYTDEKGESVPLEEGVETPQERDRRLLNGILRRQQEAAIAEALRQCGKAPRVFKALSAKLGASAEAIGRRAQQMGLLPGGEPQPPAPAWADKGEDCEVLEGDAYASWCRRCRTFGCRIHEGSHVRPILGPITEQPQQRVAGAQPEPGQEACGPHCYRLARAGPAEAAAEAGTQQQQQQQQQRMADTAGRSPDGPASSTNTQNAQRLSQQQTPRGLPPLPRPSSAAGAASSTGRPARSSGPGRATAVAAALAAATNVPARRRRGGGSSSPPPAGAAGAAGGAEQWSGWEESLLQQALQAFGKQPCRISLLLQTRTCQQVAQQLQQLGVATPREDADGDGGRGGGRGGKKRKKAAPLARRMPAAAYERLRRGGGQRESQYFPCACEGPCTRDCPCAGDANFCEKFCGCDPARCGNRFPGCRCTCGEKGVSKRCSNRQCPCLAANRECDPDLCKDCRPTLYGEHRPGWQCNNLRVRLGQKKRVLMGLSNVQGWGAFLREPAAKDDFVGEYCGELVGDEEADRRGVCYDRDDNSYLFETNQQWVIDARLKGNKLRFANHTTDANCRAQVLLVDGDHRVAILANRGIVPGEELFYNYGYDKRVAPEWAMEMKARAEREAKAKGASNRKTA